VNTAVSALVGLAVGLVIVAGVARLPRRFRRAAAH
jgi:NhaP-type Na+/H+ or K+/H+ antiporter